MLLRQGLTLAIAPLAAVLFAGSPYWRIYCPWRSVNDYTLTPGKQIVMSQKRIVIVLGMHRSGTSAMTRGLKALTVELGDNLLPPVPDNNERGFWEDRDIYKLNERLLAKAHSGWDRLSAIETGILARDEFASERREAALLLERKLAAAPLFGFKDPRTSVLLPFWKCVFEDLELDENYIIAVRNPFEVAESLGKRDKFDTDFGITLWLKYTWAAINHSAGRKRIGVGYARLMEDPALQLARLSAAFNLPLPARASPEYAEFAAEFLSPELRHNRISDNEVFRSQSIPAFLPELYQSLLKWCDTSPEVELEITSKLKAKVDTYLGQSQSLLALGDRLKISADAQAAKATAAEKSRIELKVFAEQLQGRLTEREKIISELKSAVDEAIRLKVEAIAAAEALAAKMEATESRIASLEALHEATKNSETLAVTGAQQANQRLDWLQTLNEQLVASAQASQLSFNERIAYLEGASRLLGASLEERDRQLSKAAATTLSLQSEIETSRTQLALVTQNWQATQQRLNDALAAAEYERAAADKKISEAEAVLSSAITAERQQCQRQEDELRTALFETESTLNQQLAQERERASDLEAAIEAARIDSESHLSSAIAAERDRFRELEQNLQAVHLETESTLKQQLAQERERASDLEAAIEAARIDSESHLSSAIAAERDRFRELEQNLQAVHLETESTLKQQLADEAARALELEAILLASRQEAAATLVAALSEEANRIRQTEESLKASLEEQRDKTRRLTLDLKSAKLEADSTIATLEERLREELDRSERAETEVRKIAAILKSKEISAIEQVEEALLPKINAASAELSKQYEARIEALKLELQDKARTSRLVRRQLLEIQSSSSWRITKPLRAFAIWLTSVRRTSKVENGRNAGDSLNIEE